MAYTFFAANNISSITSEPNFVYIYGAYTVIIRARLEIRTAQLLAIM